MDVKNFLLVLSAAVSSTRAFSGGNSLSQPSSAFDRFVATLPAERASILRFDPLLVDTTQSDYDKAATWVAVYRSNNNLPSVFREDFFQSMQLATKSVSSSSSSLSSKKIIVETSGPEERTPVAIARLCRSEKANQWILDNLRCSLKKENQDSNCDGGSEHVEALSVCVDELILHHLNQEDAQFNKAIRCKATLVSGPLLEARGFQEVEELSKDMATHISSLDGAIAKYSARVSESGGIVAHSPRTLDRTLQMISMLGRLDRDEEGEESPADEASENDDYDPWASVKKYI